jgi:hypothetical protein
MPGRQRPEIKADPSKNGDFLLPRSKKFNKHFFENPYF